MYDFRNLYAISMHFAETSRNLDVQFSKPVRILYECYREHKIQDIFFKCIQALAIIQVQSYFKNMNHCSKIILTNKTMYKLNVNRKGI